MEINLVMFKPDGKRKDIPLTGSTTVIGRGEECDLRVPLVSVSRHHCQLSIENDVLKIKDLGSSNGTYVNNSRVDECALAAGDRLSVGPIVFTVQIDGDPLEVSPVQPGEVAGAVGGEIDPDAIIDLQADMMGDDDDGAFIDLEGTEADEDQPLDPISALEALAAESDKKEEDQ